MHRYLILTGIMLVASAAFGQQPTAEGRQGGHHNLNRLFLRADVNHDGKISAEEWKRKPEAFNHLDQNHDGFVTREEVQTAANRLRERRSKRADKAFGRMDTNKDGRISPDEWNRGSVFERLDSNHDGVITREELTQGRGRGRRGAGDRTENTRPPSQD